MIDFETWWNSSSADEFRRLNDDMDGRVVRPVWDAAIRATLSSQKATSAAPSPEATQPTQAEAPSEREAWRGGSSYEASMLRNLLARIHGDGGHYVEQHGIDKALDDAEMLVAHWRAALAAQPAAERVPLTDEQLRALHHEDEFGLFCDFDEFEQIARAVEQAHRITAVRASKGGDR